MQATEIDCNQTKVPRDRAHLTQHLDAAYNLARWLVRDESHAEDLVQEAYLRAFRSYHSFRGDESRPWILAIVRNACYDWLRDVHQGHGRHTSSIDIDRFESRALSPEAIMLQREDANAVRHALGRLHPLFREILILREFEQLPYSEIAAITGVPKGTVMSRLSRARKHLSSSLLERQRRAS